MTEIKLNYGHVTAFINSYVVQANFMAHGKNWILAERSSISFNAARTVLLNRCSAVIALEPNIAPPADEIIQL